MSHIVIHDDNENITRYRQFDDLHAAAEYLEQLHNVDGISDAQLFRLEEVEFAVTSYVKVEIGAASAATPITASTPDPVVYEEVVSTDVAETEDTVEYVEAAMGPVDAFAPVPSDAQDQLEESFDSGEARRGLFGR